MDLDWIDVDDSERIVATAYDVDDEVIYVRFPEGKEWKYELCPDATWDAFTAPGQSKGKYIAEVLDHKPNGPA